MKALITLLLFCLSIGSFSCFAADERLLQRGLIAIAAKDYMQAIEVFDRLTRESPDNAEFMRLLAVVNERQADESSLWSAFTYARRSKQAFQRAVQLDPGNAQAIYGLMHFLGSASPFVGGDLDAAWDLMQKLEPLSPELADQARVELAARES